MPLNPMKKNPKVPTISASSLLPIDGVSMSSSCARRVFRPMVEYAPDVMCCRPPATVAAMTPTPDAPPPYSTAVGAAAPPPRRGGARGSARRRGAARAADRRRSRGRDDAHARPRRGAGARVRPLGGTAAALGPRPGRPGREHDRARGAWLRSRPAGAVVLHHVLLRRLRQGRARGDRRRVAAGREHARRFPTRSSRPCPTASARRRPRSPRREACTRPVSSRRPASSCARARTSAATTRWTR